MNLTPKQQEFINELKATTLIQCRGRAYDNGPDVLSAPSCCALSIAYKLAGSQDIREVAVIFDLKDSGIDHIFHLNDEEKLSFPAIAERMEQNPERFFQDVSPV